MKFIFPFLLALLPTLAFSQTIYPSLNISLLGQLDPCSTVNWVAPGSNTKYSGVIGWVDQQDNKEYAIIGGTDGYYFIDVSNPTSPVLKHFESGINQNCLWREMKTYGKYCYMVSDDDAPNGMIVADLSYLPDSIHVISKGSTILSRSHTVFIDGNKLYCGYVHFSDTSTTNESMCVYSLNDPEHPAFLRSLNSDDNSVWSVHDMWVQDDTVFASCGYEALNLYHYDTIQNKFNKLANFSGYVQAGYNHSSFRTANKKTLVFADEVPANTVLKILDVSDLNNMTILDTIKSNQGATPHNPYILGDTLCFVAYYQDGLYIFDIHDPTNVSVVGFFDTHPQNGLNNGYPTSPTTYMGAWAAYPFLPSRNILVSDMQNGLFILDASQVDIGVKEDKSASKINFSVFPNPANEKISVNISNCKGSGLITLTDLAGRKLYAQRHDFNSLLNNFELNISGFSSGIYFVSLESGNKIITKKIVRE
jgi:choice-of-anchor B domain-containing protein